MHHALKLTKDITGENYDRFLRAASLRFPLFMLVWCDTFTFKPSARAVRRHLRPFQIRHRRSNRWPGTVMIEQKADVIFYRFDPQALQVLQRPGSLLSWLQPEFPENLAFFGSDRACAMASVTHEKDIWILDLEFGRSLPKRIGLCKDEIGDEDWNRYFDYAA